jgi:dipeptidyl aminopeptidase/acylaminoacyl peptidase
MRFAVTAPCRLILSLLSLVTAGELSAQPAAPFTAQDLVSLRRLTDPQVSPDSRQVAYVVRETDLAANKGRTDLWLLDLATPNTQPRRLTQHEANDSNPRWAPDGRTIYFLSTRSGSSQIWRVAPGGGEPTQVTSYPLDVGSMKVAPAGNRLAFSMEVLPECADLDCTRHALDARAKDKAVGRTYDRLFVRHWDTWSNGARSHLFVASIGADGKAGRPLDLSKALDGDMPSKPFGGDEEYAFSLDGTRMVFSARVAGREEAWSTNFDLFESPVDGSAAPVNLTADNPAWDTQPVFLRNGDLAYLAMERPGFEADRFQILIRNTQGSKRALTKSWDRSVSHLTATADGRSLLAAADDLGQHALFSVSPANGAIRKLVGTGHVDEFVPAKDSVVYALASLDAPADLYIAALKSKKSRRLTSVNQDVLGQRGMSEFEQFSFSGAKDEQVRGYVVKPHGFAPGKRYPVAFVIHGGPQVSFGNLWSYRWNAQTFAGRGYGVVMIEFHGTPGYGQKFTDSISGDWGGAPLVDLQKGLAAALGKYPWLDGERACALGASYGGFMVNWIAGNWPDRFRCLVNHDGVFDQRMMYYSTEELWFPEWENGAPYFEDSRAYERFNPASLVTKWQAPMLVIHGEQDFRIPYDQGLATFTALQRLGIESKLLVFPNENHWVLKPANSVQWYGTVLDWLDGHLKN